MTVFADTREKVSIPDDFEETELPHGDYAVEGTNRFGEDEYHLFERKGWAELVEAFRKGKLFNQLGGMLEQDHEAWLIVEGVRSDARRYANARHGEVRRFLSSIMYKMDVKVWQADDTSDSHAFVRDIDDWLHDHRERTHSVRETKKVPEEMRPQYVLEGFPGVGPGTAQDILDEMGSVWNTLDASMYDLVQVDGIGRQTAFDILDTAGALDDKERLIYDLSELPGIGGKKAIEIGHHPDVNSFDDISEEILLDVDGIGQKTASKILEEAL